MLIDTPPTLLNTIMHNKPHASHLMAKSMNELAYKSPLISLCAVAFSLYAVVFSLYSRDLVLARFKTRPTTHGSQNGGHHSYSSVKVI